MVPIIRFCWLILKESFCQCPTFHQSNRSQIYPICNISHCPNGRNWGARVFINLRKWEIIEGKMKQNQAKKGLKHSVYHLNCSIVGHFYPHTLQSQVLQSQQVGITSIHSFNVKHRNKLVWGWIIKCLYSKESYIFHDQRHPKNSSQMEWFEVWIFLSEWMYSWSRINAKF